VEGKKNELVMCNECPVLHRKLHGIRPQEVQGAKTERGAGICCGQCGTTLEEVRTGSPLGCIECYETFADVIVFDLVAARRVSERLEMTPSARVPLHVGRQPGETPTISPQVKLVALHEALEETLKREDYEQAAWLRDQIKQLEQNIDEGPKG
jgi:protein arginine kinase activator